MTPSRRRLLGLLLAAPTLLVGCAAIYGMAMSRLEGEDRTFLQSLQWAGETLTTTGYGHDTQWSHPVTVGFVIFTQFSGLVLSFVTFSLVVVPFFEARFEGRLPRSMPKLRDYVLVYRYGPAVSKLLAELRRGSVRTLVLEEDEPTARRLIDRGQPVVFMQLDEEDPDPRIFLHARAIVAAGSDQDNASLILAARQAGFEGEILALADVPLHRKPMMLAGASGVYTPLHIVAAAMAALASERINPRLSGLGRVRGHLHTAELRIFADSELAGKTLAEAGIRAKTGATVIGQWRGGTFEANLTALTTLHAGAILTAVGSDRALEKLGKLAKPLRREGPIVVCGYGAVGQKVVELLRDAGEPVVVLDRVQHEGVDIVGDVLDRATLQRAQVDAAQTVILALGDDSSTLFAASVIRDHVRDVPIIARVNRAEHVERIHLAGADFGLSLSEVAAELLAQKLLGAEWISLEARVKVERVGPAGLVGKSPVGANVGALTGCTVVAVERGGEITVELPERFRVEKRDILYICGLEANILRYFEAFPGSRLTRSSAHEGQR
jgi:Trk K+ transport system NAD-binding subunit